MLAGQLDRVIDLQRMEVIEDPVTGEWQEVFTTYATERAKLAETGGREFFAANTTIAEQKATFLIRWRGDVLVTDRVSYGGKAYNINSTREVGRRVGLELQCTVRP
ncbi:hypothetical protein CCR97_10200 [Rhodoplanes elegans]|uniref:Head-tail adaptor protein n=1 Tax=Rhodoplanes elegans TaxID=29408 RepID=A0A327KNR4_9BRAD|nr:phage head closure protein [Rhodoplanes elegans]MBK5958577.1 hypothetical protein [Rhodoplanes elegans]RAI40530.1 hypothetical protein CH338_05960 [Rhodoplanes elegans]